MTPRNDPLHYYHRLCAFYRHFTARPCDIRMQEKYCAAPNVLVLPHSLCTFGELQKTREQVSSVNTISTLTAAAKSNWPGAAPGLETVPFGAGALLPGRGAAGIAGLPGCFAAGFTATGGGPGFGLFATGGGGFPAVELDGRELVGVVPVEVFAPGFFHGVEDDVGTAPGKTATGFADASATIGLAVTFGVEAPMGAPGAEGGGRRAGGGGAVGGALGFGGSSSR